MKHITFICTGNICRSPIAEALLKARIVDRGIEVSSLGTHALVGQPADPLAIEVMGMHGHDLASHRARQATSPLLIAADLILAMDYSHIEWAIARMPQLRGRVFRLGKWRDDLDIADPYRQPLSAFTEAHEIISGAVDDWLKRL